MPAARSRLPADQWGWLVFKLFLGFGWTHAMFVFTPTSIADNLNPVAIAVWTGGTALGAAVSIVGMFLATSPHLPRVRLGLAIEIVGIIFLAGGPLQYLGVQVGFITADNFDQRYALAWFAAAMLVPLIGVRLVDVVRRLVRSTRAAIFTEPGT